MKSHDTSPRPDSSEDIATIHAVAAAWLGLHDGGLTAEQERQLAQWRDEDPRHAAALAALEETWNSLDQLSAVRPAGEPDPGLLVRDRRPRLRRVVAPLLLAAAAVVAALWIWSPTLRPRAAVLAQQAATEIGVQQTLDLPDGSVVRLNTDTAVEVVYSQAERRVRLLRGEAHFKVAKNPARPFIVSAGKVDVRAVGTAFNVRLRPGAIQVLVAEGKVRVDDPAKGESVLQPRAAGNATPLLAAGERVEIRADAPAPAPVVSVAPGEVERMLAWQQRRLEFAATPLEEVVSEFNRYNRHKLIIADPELGRHKFGGTFRADRYDALVRLLELNFDVVATERGDSTTLRLAR